MLSSGAKVKQAVWIYGCRKDYPWFQRVIHPCYVTLTIMHIMRVILLQYNVSSVPATSHYYDVIMDTIAYQITSLTIVCSTVYSDADQRKHQSSSSLAFVRGIHRGPVNSPHKGPVTRKMLPFDDVIMSQDACIYDRQIQMAFNLLHK